MSSNSSIARISLAAILWTCLAAGANAQGGERLACSQPGGPSSAVTNEELERFRADLMTYVDDLSALPYSMLEAFHENPQDLPAARAEIATLSAGELYRIKQALDSVPFWKSLPGFLATTLPNEAYLSPLELAARLDVGQVQRLAQRSPRQLDELVARFEELPGRLPADALPPDYEQRVAGLKARLQELRPVEVEILRRQVNARVPLWHEKLQASKRAAEGAGGAAVTADKDHCDPGSSSCGSLDFPDDILCEIEAIIDEIAAIPCRVGEFAVEAANFIVDSFESLLSFVEDLIPDGDDIEEAILSVLSVDLTDPTWAKTLFPAGADKLRVPGPVSRAVDEVAAIPCPVAFGDAAPDFVDSVSVPVLSFLVGDFGDQVSANRCDRRFRFLPQIIFSFLPPCGLSTAGTIAVSATTAIIDYLCFCYEAASDINFDDNQQVHREDVAGRFCQDGVDDDDCQSWIRYDVVNGDVDLNLDGLINGADLGTATGKILDDDGDPVNSVLIFSGSVDFDKNLVINSNDSGTFNGFSVFEGEIDIDGDGVHGETNGDDDGVVGETLIDELFLKVSDLAEGSGDCDTADGEAAANCIQEKVGAFVDGAFEAGSIRRQVADLDDDVAALNDDLDDLDGDVAAVGASLDASLEDSGDLAADLEAFQDLALQLRIEADLVRDGDQRIGLFQLPSVVCSASDPEICGLIETVATVLTEAIAFRQQAGRDVSGALFYLERGNNLYQEGSFKKAYTEYRNAYRELVLTRN